MALKIFKPTATILSGAALSDAVRMNGCFIDGIIMPAAWTAADMSFATCETEAGTYADVYDSFGNEIAITVDAGRLVMLPPGLIRASTFLKLRSGVSGATVNQGADRSFTLLARAAD